MENIGVFLLPRDITMNVIYVSRQLNMRNGKVLFLLLLRSFVCLRRGILHKVITQVNMGFLCGCYMIIKDEIYS